MLKYNRRGKFIVIFVISTEIFNTLVHQKLFCDFSLIFNRQKMK